MEPKAHQFQYQVLMFYIDLNEVSNLFSIPFFFSSTFPRLLGFDRDRYLTGSDSLEQAVKDLIFKKTGKKHEGPVRLLTQISYFGFCFNPVSFYYCFDAEERLRFIVSEITNTPWNERSSYVHEVDHQKKHHRYEFQKDFHVSPFMPMNLHYVWNFSTPEFENDSGVSQKFLSVHMEDWDQEKTRKVFDATLLLKPRPWSASHLIASLLMFPLLTFKSFVAIYWQAFLLKLKNIPFYPHPDSGEKS
jgi:DUF1365 family protein